MGVYGLKKGKRKITAKRPKSIKVYVEKHETFLERCHVPRANLFHCLQGNYLNELNWNVFPRMPFQHYTDGYGGHD